MIWGAVFFPRIANERQWHILLWLFWMLLIFQVGDLKYYSCRFPFFCHLFSCCCGCCSIFHSFWIHLIQSRNDNNRSFKLLSTALNALTRNIIRLRINNTMSSTTTVMTVIINISFFLLFFLFVCVLGEYIWCRFRSSISLGSHKICTTESNLSSFTCVIEMNLLRETLWIVTNVRIQHSQFTSISLVSVLL